MPIRFIIILRRRIDLQQILKQNQANTLLYKFFNAQLQNPSKNDWVTQAVKDLESLNIDLELQQIENMSEDKYTQLCKQNVRIAAFNYLMDKKNKSEIRKHIKYTKLEMAEYLQEDDFCYSIREKQNLFACRMYDLDVKANRTWKYNDLFCKSCNIPNEIETQEHILQCKTLIEQNTKVTYLPNYSDLFSSEIQEQIYTSTIICENLRLRDELQA